MSQADDFLRAAEGELGKGYTAHRDCSGLVAWAGRQVGLTLPEGSEAQKLLGTPVPRGAEQAGDICHWATASGHTGIADGRGYVISAMNETAGIVRTPLDGSYGGRFSGCRRLDWKDGGETSPPKDPSAGGSVSFGNVKHPPYETHIVPKPWEGAGFDRVAPRKPVGTCDHQWWGYGDKLSLFRLFGTGGERQADALTDYSVTRKGEITLLNEWWGTRAPWANGPANDLDGDGPLFVRKLGVVAVNGRLVSIEYEGKGEPMTEAQMKSGAELEAYLFDSFRVPYDEYPFNPAAGCTTHMQHWEFGPKECPFAGIRGQSDQFQDRIRGILKQGQTGGPDRPIPPINPPEPDHDWLPKGLTEKMVTELFGQGARDDGAAFGFDPKGIISNAWLARGAKDGMYPGVKSWWRLKEGEATRNVVSFENGWVLMGSGTDRSSWKWV